MFNVQISLWHLKRMASYLVDQNKDLTDEKSKLEKNGPNLNQVGLMWVIGLQTVGKLGL